MVSGDPAEAAQELGQLAQNLEQRAQQFQELHTTMSNMTVTETSSAGRVTVTVDGNGVPTDIRLAESARGVAPSTVSAELMTCLQRAQATLRDQVADLVHNTVGDDAAGAQMVDQFRDRFPDPDPTEPAPEPAAPQQLAWTPPPAFPGPPQADQPQRRRGAHRDEVFTPDEPSEEDLYYQRKSWLE